MEVKEIKESVKKFALRVLSESRVDIDMDYCKKNGIVYDNHEIDALDVDLFNTKSNKNAFNVVFKNR